MDTESGGFARCVRHPSQFFTGFCSSCLAERLSSVEPAERKRVDASPCEPEGEIVEMSNVVMDPEKKGSEVRERMTLLSLFRLDDACDVEERKTSEKEHFVAENSSSVNESLENDCDRSKNAQAGGDFDESFHASFWLTSMVPKKVLRWSLRSSSLRKSLEERSWSGECSDKESKNKRRLRHSCDWRTSHDPIKSSWEAPRHSWDGSMMSKALACSFACLEEGRDSSCCITRGLPGEAMVKDPQSSHDTAHKSIGNNVSEGCHRDPQQQITVPGIIRKKSHRWSRVWDRSITSPLRDFVKKREHVLERSLSESWRHGHRDKNIEPMGLNGGVKFVRNGKSSARMNHGRSRSISSVSGDLKTFRADWQKKKSEFRFGRSRSVHYSSPGNLDNGLLRFYLTPLRSSRRNMSNNRGRNSRSFARGILGL